MRVPEPYVDDAPIVSDGRTTPGSPRTAPVRPRMARLGRIALFLIVVAIGIALDQASKAFMRGMLADGARIPFIPGIIDFLLVHNTGAAFSIGQGMGWIFIVVAIAVSLGAFAYVWLGSSLNGADVFFIACIVAGGLGNLIDRVLFGSVTDFIATAFIDFPVFNVADILVCTGVGMTLILALVEDSREAGAGEAR